jgi:hypothetical protein
VFVSFSDTSGRVYQPRLNAMSEDDRRIVEFNRLNVVGKAVFVAGTAMKIAGGVLESAMNTFSVIITETERAFQQGLDANVEDANILTDEEKVQDEK